MLYFSDSASSYNSGR